LTPFFAASTSHSINVGEHLPQIPIAGGRGGYTRFITEVVKNTPFDSAESLDDSCRNSGRRGGLIHDVTDVAEACYCHHCDVDVTELFRRFHRSLRASENLMPKLYRSDYSLPLIVFFLNKKKKKSFTDTRGVGPRFFSDRVLVPAQITNSGLAQHTLITTKTTGANRD